MPDDKTRNTVDVVLVFLSGQVCAHHLDAKGILESLTRTALDREVIIDLRGVARLERSAVVALAKLSRKLVAAGGQLFLSGVSADLHTMFEVSELDAPAPLLDESSLMDRITGEVPSHA